MKAYQMQVIITPIIIAEDENAAIRFLKEWKIKHPQMRAFITPEEVKIKQEVFPALQEDNQTMIFS